MSFHDRNNCHCPTCMNYRRMIDALQVSDLRMATSNPAPVPVPDSFASLAMQIVDPVPSRLSSAIHSSMPVPSDTVPEFIRKRMRKPELQDIHHICNVVSPQPDRTMTKNQYARWLLGTRLQGMRATINGITTDKDLNPLLEQITLLEARVAEVFQ